MIIYKKNNIEVTLTVNEGSNRLVIGVSYPDQTGEDNAIVIDKLDPMIGFTNIVELLKEIEEQIKELEHIKTYNQAERWLVNRPYSNNWSKSYLEERTVDLMKQLNLIPKEAPKEILKRTQDKYLVYLANYFKLMPQPTLAFNKFGQLVYVLNDQNHDNESYQLSTLLDYAYSQLLHELPAEKWEEFSNLSSKLANHADTLK